MTNILELELKITFKSYQIKMIFKEAINYCKNVNLKYNNIVEMSMLNKI